MAAIVFLLVSSTALSQQSAANLNGAVRDLTGAVVQGATVSLANLATGVKHETTTNESGVYTFTNVLPGDYSLTASKEGFSPATHQNMHTQVNQSITQDFELKPGATATEVIVQATSAELNTANASIGEVIETKSVHDLPLNGRNFTLLMTLVPGVAPVNTGPSSTGGQTNPLGAFVAPSINGQELRSNYYRPGFVRFCMPGRSFRLVKSELLERCCGDDIPCGFDRYRTPEASRLSLRWALIYHRNDLGGVF
jgi:hypothetical protein